VQALILVGGEGTRLRPLTSHVPKPALRLVDRPFIAYMVEWLARHGVDDVVLACGFRSQRLRDVLGDGGNGGPRLRYVEEPEPRGTAGAIRFAEDHLGDRFLALNGDVLADLDLTALVARHHEVGAAATLGLYRVEDPTGYGLISTDSAGRITEFVEKPEPGHAGPGDVNAGTYVLERSVLELIPPDREVSIEREVFPAMVGGELHGLRLEGYWMDIGTPGRYLQASWDILEGRVKTGVGERLDRAHRLIEPGAEVASGAEVAPPLLLEAGARVAAGAKVGPRAVVSRGCEIGPGATVESAVLHDDCTIGASATVRDAILAPGVEVEPGCEVLPGSVIGEGELVDKR
jgi:mannose-1-phosphate guanylyltransferase